jgi:hypothetical protein
MTRAGVSKKGFESIQDDTHASHRAPQAPSRSRGRAGVGALCDL